MKYRKKPVVIDAELYKKGMEDGFKANFVDYGCYTDEELKEKHGLTFDDIKKPYIKTIEGEMIISEGDWIITGIRGERYPCKPDIFEQTYERVYVTKDQKTCIDNQKVHIRQPTHAII